MSENKFWPFILSALSDNSANYIDNSEYTLWVDYIFLDEDEKSRFLTSNSVLLLKSTSWAPK